ncbi:MAG: dTDP-4-dehydrorhamnose reductase [Nitrospirota bacterium]
MRYLITGKNGQLANAFAQRLAARSLEYLAPEESRCDITDPACIRELVGAYRPGVIINCAAYNLVDRAEQERDKAFAVNGAGPRILAEAARERGAFLVHFGSDYVFDGYKENGLYREEDPTDPLNEYGRSKLAGEQAVREVLAARSLVLRLSWVFGEGNQNFIVKLLGWSRDQPFLKVACDEFSVPTWTETVVDVTLRALEQGLTGLYHCTNSGYCSRYEWAKAILRQQGIDRFIRPVSMDSFNLPAKRPKFSAMSSRTIAEILGRPIMEWDEAVAQFIKKGTLS